MEIQDKLEALNKRILDKVEEISIDMLATTAYGLAKKAYNQNYKDNTTLQSTWDSVRSPLLK